MLYGTSLLEQGDDVVAIKHLEEALALGRRSGSKVLVGGALNGLAWAALARGDVDRAVDLAEEGLSLYLAAGDNQGTSDSLVTVGWTAFRLGNLERATECFSDLLHLAWDRGKKRHLAHALRGLGIVACERGELERGARFVARATAIWPALNLPHRPSTEAVEFCLAQASRQLGETAWQAAWDAGASMAVDTVVADALKQRASQV